MKNISQTHPKDRVIQDSWWHKEFWLITFGNKACYKNMRKNILKVLTFSELLSWYSEGLHTEPQAHWITKSPMEVQAFLLKLSQTQNQGSSFPWASLEPVDRRNTIKKMYTYPAYKFQKLFSWMWYKDLLSLTRY